jgi:hypothetical protein
MCVCELRYFTVVWLRGDANRLRERMRCRGHDTAPICASVKVASWWSSGSAGLGSAHGDWHSFDGRRRPSCGSVDAELME